MKKKRTIQRKLLFGFIAFILFSFVTILIAELGLRLIRHLNSAHYPTHNIVPDDLLGWKAAENYFFTGELQDLKDDSYAVTISTNHLGFRQFDSISNSMEQKKVWFIGDSFTHAIEVGDDKTYYRRLSDSLPIAVFAYGGRGFGTLQEYMILDKYCELIQPDVVVLQFCSNDFLNNSYILERQSFYNNNRMMRPYWQANGSIIYRNPTTVDWTQIGRFSQFVPFFTTKIERIFDHLQHRQKKCSEDLIELEGMNFVPFQESLKITEMLLKKIQQRLYPHTRLMVFDVHEYQPYKDALANICKNNGIQLVNAVYPRLKQEMENGKTIFGTDGAHWNEEGHKIVAEVLMEYLVEDD